jgi:hypothetical protein
LLAGSAAAKEQTSRKGIPFDDNSDDDSEEGEAENTDTEVEEEKEEEEDSMAPKTPKKTPSTTKKAKRRLVGDAIGETIVNRMADLSIEVPMYSMDLKAPFILTPYKDQFDDMLKVQVFVPTLPRDSFVPDIVDGGNKLEIKIQVPPFFVDENRIIASNACVDGFNHNTHLAQAFKTSCEEIVAPHGMMINNIFGQSIEIAMPFLCEERIVLWEIQAYPNNMGSLTDALGGQQFHMVLVVIARKLRTKRMTTGGFRIIGADDNSEDQL